MSYREEIKQRLEGVDQRHCVAFAARAALRSLPLLAGSSERKSAFWYWDKAARPKYLLSILSVQRSSLAFAAISRSGGTANVADVAAYAGAYAGVRAAAYVYVAAYAAARTAHANPAADAAADAADATYAAARTANPAAAFIEKYRLAAESDLRDLSNRVDVFTILQKSLWPEGLPADWQAYWVSFADWSISLNAGFDVWLDWYQDRLDGKELDLDLLEKQVLIPEEIKSQGVASVNGYLATLIRAKKTKADLRPLNLVRAIFIGNGEAGKTSLIRALNGEPVVQGQEKMTPGVDIREWPVGDTDITAHFWDFGGQVMAHSTHQFFLRERCLYVLVLDARTEFNANEQAEYWLEHIKAFGKNAKVMLVGNKSDLAAVNLNLATLRDKYSNIIGFYPLSCTRHEDQYEALFAAFRSELVEQLQAVDTHQVYFTEQQFAVLQKLKQCSLESAFLPHDDFRAICHEQQIASDGPQDQNWLLDLFDKLGVVIHFPQLARLDSYVLNPRWLTYGIYTLLYSEQARNGQGVLSEAQVVDILRAKEVTDNQGNVLDYPADKCGFVIDAMEEFKLCYRLGSDKREFVIPDLLPSDRPKLDFDKDKEDTLVFEFAFDGFLPRHVMPTLIVSRYDEIKRLGSVWQQGVVLHNADYVSEALVQVDYHTRRLSMWVQGEQSRRYFTVIRDQIIGILRRMADLSYQEWVWLNSGLLQSGVSELRLVKLRLVKQRFEKANFLQLLKMEQAGQMTYISQSGANYDVADILRIMPQKFRRNIAAKSEPSKALDSTDSVTVFISYAHKDEDYKDALVTRLKGIQRQFECLEWWDDRQMVSGEWDPQILKKLERAEIAVLLISPDFIASDYCFNTEMKAALQKYHERGKRVIPIIIRHTVDWNTHAIGKLQALPKDAKPLDEWKNPDRFWGDVQNALTREIERLLVSDSD